MVEVADLCSTSSPELELAHLELPVALTMPAGVCEETSTMRTLGRLELVCTARGLVSSLLCPEHMILLRWILAAIASSRCGAESSHGLPTHI